MYVRQYRDAPSYVEPPDLRQTLSYFDGRQVAEGDLLTGRGGHQEIADRLYVVAVLRQKPGLDRELSLTLVESADLRAPDRRLHHVHDIRDVDAVSRDGETVRDNVQVIYSGDLFDRHIRCPRYLLKNRGDPVRAGEKDVGV